MTPIPETTLRKLEYDKVLERIAAMASSDPGRAAVRALTPLHSAAEAARRLQVVSEAKEMLIAEGASPIESFRDVLPALKKTTVTNQSLSAMELIEIARLLRSARTTKGFLAKRAALYPKLATNATRLSGDKVVEYNIDQALDENGSVKDGASRELREIRNGMIAAGDALRKRLESILRRVSEQELLQDEIITTRDGRLVIPVKIEFKNRIPGFIHSTSASGATVYVEPAESLELNNALREFQLREQREIHRILLELTRQVGAIRETAETSYHALVELDVLFAAARYSIEIIGCAPALSDTPLIRLSQARHPALLRHLRREQVVPLSLFLDADTRCLVITGPNAGGKTVALKTVGLLVLMARTGLHLPAASDTVVYPFPRIFVDIGDDQSIDDDLSTFSSHLLRLKGFLDDADRDTLVLLDEIGAGTDPGEGGALAAAVLQQLTAAGAMTLATTHHGALKVFAHETPGVVNGSMEFDTATIRPTYVFRAGIPGSSFAFELARRIGLPSPVLADARSRSGHDQSRLEGLLTDLEDRSQRLTAELSAAVAEKGRLQHLVEEYEQKLAGLKTELHGIRRRAIDEASELVSGAQRRIEQTIKDIREQSASREAIQSSRQVLETLKQDLTDLGAETPAGKAEEESVQVGDRVRFIDGVSVGEVVELSGSTAIVLSGQARVRVPVAKLRHAPASAVTNAPYVTSVGAELPPAANEIDLRGLLGAEALERLVPFLDNAYAAGLARVDIIHGKGTGALRKRIAEFLKTYPHVRSFRLGEWNEGGAGVTVVEIGESSQ